MLGLLGETPEGVAVESIPETVAAVKQSGRLRLLGRHEIAFREAEHLVMQRSTLPFHPNGLRFTALGAQGEALRTRVYYSVTAAGKKRLATIVHDWTRITRAVSQVLEGASHGIASA